MSTNHRCLWERIVCDISYSSKNVAWSDMKRWTGSAHLKNVVEMDGGIKEVGRIDDFTYGSTHQPITKQLPNPAQIWAGPNDQ